jgi:hypothetical protein
MSHVKLIENKSLGPRYRIPGETKIFMFSNIFSPFQNLIAELERQSEQGTSFKKRKLGQSPVSQLFCEETDGVICHHVFL